MSACFRAIADVFSSPQLVKVQSVASSWQDEFKGRRVMYFNALGEKVSAARYREMANAAKNRRELIAAGLTSRRDLFKMGLLTAGGMLVPKLGLSARARSEVPTA